MADCPTCGQSMPSRYLADNSEVYIGEVHISLSFKEREIVNLLRASSPSRWLGRELAEKVNVTPGSMRVLMTRIRKAFTAILDEDFPITYCTGGYYWHGTRTRKDRRAVPSPDIQTGGVAGIQAGNAGLGGGS